MIPISYQVTGEEEYSFRLEIDGVGNYTVHTGTYTTQKPRTGKLSPEQQSSIRTAIDDLGSLKEHPRPTDGKAFQVKLVLGEGNKQVVYSFWEGALEQDKPLESLVRLLEVI